MKLESIMELWQQDCEINNMELGDEAIKIAKLHSKYYQIYINEKLVLKKYEVELKQLKLEKYEFYTQGPTEEQFEKGWELPASGKVLRTDANNYVDADQDVVNLILKYSVQKEKVDFLDSIIKSLVNRGFNIKAAIDFERFRSGV
tara:strand:+ start:237 stop:671 length:435 start_codon:yes stop_codon:yes gene_type:complete